MSKIGKRPIDTSSVDIKLDGNKVLFKGKEFSGEHVLPEYLKAKLEDNKLTLEFEEGKDKRFIRQNKNFWGLHRALLSNKILGSKSPFQKQVKITGLGYKAQLAGNKINFALGFSHKIDLDLPKGVTLEIDKTGQLLTFKSAQKDVLGLICDKVKSLKPTEPYKGTGIKLADEVIIRKAGKAKS